ncbi:MAG: ribose-phosphate pyrophosphokinase [Prochloraceae cyanobacterium]|nr:ribose-phosphate pyrophosphokinase [Prochloraceae cyanobacterium]
MRKYIFLAGRANPALAKEIATELGICEGAVALKRFPDGETAVQLLESVRQQWVFLLQPTSPPVNENLLELLTLVDACRRAGAERIIAIVPYFGYSRSDKRHGRWEPITASMVAELLQVVGVAQLITFDLHASQIEGFFHIPVDSLTAVPILYQALAKQLPADVVVVSPDTGRVMMASQYAQLLHTEVVVLHKQRISGTETEVTQVVGEVRSRPCLIVDDMISTGGTIAKSVKALLEAGAAPEIYVAATHGLFVGKARNQLGHDSIKALWITNTISPPASNWPQLQVVSVAPLIADAIEQLTK